MAKHKLLTLDEAVLYSMSGNPNFVKEFPFLAPLSRLRNKKGGCGRCGRNKSAAQRVNAVNSIRSALATMGDAKKQKLKELLNADQVRIRVANGGKIQDHVF